MTFHVVTDITLWLFLGFPKRTRTFPNLPSSFHEKKTNKEVRELAHFEYKGMCHNLIYFQSNSLQMSHYLKQHDTST